MNTNLTKATTEELLEKYEALKNNIENAKDEEFAEFCEIESELRVRLEMMKICSK